MLICFHKLGCEQFYLWFEFLDLFGFWVIILDRFIRNSSCFCCIEKSAIIFSKVLIWWVQVSDHASESISANALSKEWSKLRVSVRNIDSCGVFLSWGNVVQGSNYLAQCEKRLIDFNAFLLGFTIHFCKLLPLGTGQIYQLKFWNHNWVWALGIYLLKRDAKYCVGTRTCQIHFVTAYDLVPQTILEQS